MIRIVGVRFQKAGKIYYFDPLDFELETAMHVIVETARGIEMGTVLIPPKDVEDDKVIQPLKPVIRVATDEDERVVEENKEKEKEAFAICKEKILQHGLEMKLVNAEYTFDCNKLLFYFTADGRIDFRELVKDLAAIFRTRIELRQIGVRDETKMMGGIGICGRELCCKSYLADFVPVSIKMAKEQNLSLNPTKISGVCGRLMCCLKNEQDTYEYLNSRLPSVGDIVTTQQGLKGEVVNVNVLRQLVKVVVDNGEEKELREYSVDELEFRPKRRKDVKITEEELKELEGLEDVVEEVTEERGEGRKDRGDRSDRGDRRERGERRDRDRGDRTDRGDKNERGDRSDRNDQGDRTDRSDRNDWGDRTDRSDRNDRGDRTDRGDRIGRSDREGQEDRDDRENRIDRGDRNERGDRGDRNDRSDRNDRGDRRDRRDKYRNRDRFDSDEKGDNTERENKEYHHNRNRDNYGRNRNHKGKRNFDRDKNRNRDNYKDRRNDNNANE